MIRNILFPFVLCALLLSGCPAKEPSNPPKPTSIPANALHVGGQDGGVYIKLDKIGSDPPDCYRAEVFDERSGVLWYRGKLKLVPRDSASIDVKNADLFTGWDGDALLLKDGRRLVVQR